MKSANDEARDVVIVESLSECYGIAVSLINTILFDYIIMMHYARQQKHMRKQKIGCRHTMASSRKD